MIEVHSILVVVYLVVLFLVPLLVDCGFDFDLVVLIVYFSCLSYEHFHHFYHHHYRRRRRYLLDEKIVFLFFHFHKFLTQNEIHRVVITTCYFSYYCIISASLRIAWSSSYFFFNTSDTLETIGSQFF